MTIDKRMATATEAVAGIKDGAIVLVSGFGEAGNPTELVHALVDQGASDLVVVNNNAGTGQLGLAKLLAAGQVSKVICSFPRSAKSVVFQDLYKAGKIELEVVPQGTLAERLRASGAGIGGFFTPTSASTPAGKRSEPPAGPAWPTGAPSMPTTTRLAYSYGGTPTASPTPSTATMRTPLFWRSGHC